MNQIQFENPRNQPFPEDTILKEQIYGPGTTKFYVYDGRTLVETRSYPSVDNRTATYRITRQLQDKYPDFDVQSNTWNPIRHRVYGENYTTTDLPVMFVEVQ